jgi:ferritin-like protein
MAKATKAQKATALAALTGDPTTSTLAKAGVEVKLTKGEIAEYISTKAITTIEKEIETLRERIYKLDVDTPVDSFPKRFKPVIAALNASNFSC